MSACFADPPSIPIVDIADVNPQVGLSEKALWAVGANIGSLLPMNLLHMINDSLLVSAFVAAKPALESVSAHLTTGDFKHFIHLYGGLTLSIGGEELIIGLFLESLVLVRFFYARLKIIIIIIDIIKGFFIDMSNIDSIDEIFLLVAHDCISCLK